MKLSQLKGMPVVSVQGADKLGTVDEVLFERQAEQITALRVNMTGLFAGHRFIAWKNVKSVGDSAVTVADSSALQQEDELPAKGQNPSLRSVVGTKVITENGSEAGSVTDVDLDSASGSVTGYVLSTSLLDKIQNKQHLIPVSWVLTIGDNLIVVSDQTLNSQSTS